MVNVSRRKSLRSEIRFSSVCRAVRLNCSTLSSSTGKTWAVLFADRAGNHSAYPAFPLWQELWVAKVTCDSLGSPDRGVAS